MGIMEDVVKGFVVAGLAFGSCAPTRYEPYGAGPLVETVMAGGPESTKLDSDYQTMIVQKNRIGQQLVEIIREDGECDQVEYYLHDFGGGKDLLIRCYERDRGAWPMWGVNFDNACRAYLRTGKLIVIRISDKIITETSRGEIIQSPSFDEETAVMFTQTLNSYITNNNGENCKGYAKFYHNYIGPDGPDK